MREQLRVLEARVNADEKLDPAVQLELHAPVTAVYEALDDLLDWLALQGGGEPV